MSLVNLGLCLYSPFNRSSDLGRKHGALRGSLVEEDTVGVGIGIGAACLAPHHLYGLLSLRAIQARSFAHLRSHICVFLFRVNKESQESGIFLGPGIDAPTAQSFLNYLLLAIIYGGLLIYRRRRLEESYSVYYVYIVAGEMVKWYYYLFLGLIDVEANYLVVKAYRYTSLTSVMLLDCWAIPSVIFLTWMFLKTKYILRKFFAVAICISGLFLVVLSDVHAGDRAGGIDPIKGDILVIAGSTMYAISNVSEEFLVKTGDKVELMAMLGTFGAIISAFQISIFERNELKSIHWTAGAVVPFLAFALAMFLFYSSVPVLLKISGSTMLNLSLLTSDMWAVFIRMFVYHEKVDWIYFLAFAAVALGLVIYSGDSDEDENEARVAKFGGSNQ